ncbi:MAG: Serine/threonine-protein kinase PrkC, partial [Chlamydiae bacterium]|nr:Serine/threonine-protein kinase PrkC [Chlamydiota bacterium]
MAEGEGKFYKQPTLPTFEEKEGETLVIPEKIGPYKIETLLAKGGMSLLYLGFDPETKEPRVIKVLSPEYMNHPEMVDHFLWEAKIISLADHPNIVKLYDHGKWEEGLYIAMEFIRGVSLRQFLMQQSFSLKRCLDIILQISYALCHLHTHGVIHRDLKPENILIAEDGEIKVIDFGIAQLHEEEPRITHKIIGTPSYMSPEQKENPANVSFSSDIFALGVITYELVLGKLSYGMINLSLLPAGLQKIVGKALAVSPSERYQDSVEFITDLTDYYKSPEIEHERTGTDQVIEQMEIIQKVEATLSTFEKPKWPQFDIGIAKEREPNQFGFYLDFFKFANNTMAIILAHTTSSTLTSSIHMASFRGMIKTLMSPHLTTETAF